MRLRTRISARFGDIFSSGAPFGRLTTMGVGGAAALFFAPRSIGEAAAVASFLKRAGVPTFYLGGGSNSICTDDCFDGAVLSLRGLSKFRFLPGTLIAQAGTSLARLVHRASRVGAGGLECLAGIPGTVGGAAYMNAGGRAGDIAGRVRSLLVLDPARAELVRLPRGRIPYRYRSSGLHGRLVLEVELAIEGAEPARVAARTREILDKKRASQPLKARSAGCVFKNPTGDAAARLIDRAGLKGSRVGGALVSERHANFICSDRGTRAGDVFALIERVRRTVEERYGVRLALEVRRPSEHLVR